MKKPPFFWVAFTNEFGYNIAMAFVVYGISTV